MSKQLLPKIRNSASLILLAKNQCPENTTFDYNALLFTRPSKSSFMPDTSVFPGGVCETADSSIAWLEHFQRYDISAAKLREFYEVTQNASCEDTSEESLHTAAATRLTALRETFEEMGILLCRDRKTLTSTDGYAEFNEQFDRKHWQHVVHNDASKFLTLCQELDILPDLWALHEWSIWRTPSSYKSRFLNTCYLTALKEQPSVLTEPNEVKDAAWRSPLEYLQSGLQKQLILAGPQLYELSRFLNFQSLEKLRQFAEKRASNGSVLYQAVMYKCTDGVVRLLPGDDMYPDNPDASKETIKTGVSMEDFRAQAKQNIHRSEQINPYETQLILNFDPADGQVRPLDPCSFNIAT